MRIALLQHVETDTRGSSTRASLFRCSPLTWATEPRIPAKPLHLFIRTAYQVGTFHFLGVVFELNPSLIALFTGSDAKEQIKVWDIRARATVYELATGNNAVQALAWDSKRSTLYAATQCMYWDRGTPRGYKRVKIPQWARLDPEGKGESSVHWPMRAHHGEKDFGYAFDAGKHGVSKSCSRFQVRDRHIIDCGYFFQSDTPSRKYPT